MLIAYCPSIPPILGGATLSRCYEIQNRKRDAVVACCPDPVDPTDRKSSRLLVLILPFLPNVPNVLEFRGSSSMGLIDRVTFAIRD
jgi:hypothetical protein